MGAWIETDRELGYCVNDVSHPTWVRGLKLINLPAHLAETVVAPYVGAWIETFKKQAYEL